MPGAIDRARIEPQPFYHLEFDGIFPDGIYAAMLDALPNSRDSPLPSSRTTLPACSKRGAMNRSIARFARS